MPQTSPAERAQVGAWARARGMRYEALTTLPAEAPDWYHGRLGSSTRRHYRKRSFVENQCQATLPNGFPVIAGHYTESAQEDESPDPWHTTTFVMGLFPGSRRVVRHLEAGRVEPSAPAATVYRVTRRAERGRGYTGPGKSFDVGGVRWRCLPEQASERVVTVAERAAAAGIDFFPIGSGVTCRIGWVMVTVDKVVSEPAALDVMCAVLAAVGEELEAVGARHGVIEPGHGALPGPPDGVLLAEGREARFGTEYARRRGMRDEDPDLLSLHLPLPFRGRAYRSLYGTVAGHQGRPADLRLVWWLDPVPFDLPPRELRLAIVPAPAGARSGAGPSGYSQLVVGDWLVLNADVPVDRRDDEALDRLAGAAAAVVAAA